MSLLEVDPATHVALPGEGAPTAPRRASTLRRLVVTLVLMLPTLVALAYFGLLASDRYVSEAQFVVRTAAKPVGGGGLGAILQMAGLGRAQDEIYSVQSFMGSRTAAEQLAERLPLRTMYSHPDADFVARFPSFIYGDSAEELHRYLSWMITTIHSSTTGLTTLRVQAFRAEDAQQLALALLELGEQTINRLNARIHTDAVRSAEAEVKRADAILKGAQAKKVAAEAIAVGVRTQYEGIQGGQVLVAVPGVAPVTDVLIQNAADGLDAKDRLPEPTGQPPAALTAEDLLNRRTGMRVAQNGVQTSPNLPPVPESPGAGAAGGIETPAGDGVRR